MWEVDHKEGWAPKNWCFWTVVCDKSLENPLDCKAIKLVSPKGNQPWIFIGRAKAESSIFWPLYAKSRLIGEDPDFGKDWGQEERGWQRMSWLESITNSVDVNLSKLRVIVKGKGAWLPSLESQWVRHNWVSTFWNLISSESCRVHSPVSVLDILPCHWMYEGFMPFSWRVVFWGVDTHLLFMHFYTFIHFYAFFNWWMFPLSSVWGCE